MLETPKVFGYSQSDNPKNVTMDNQQKTDIAYATYLACTLDDEGYVSLIPNTIRGRLQFLARISLNNSDMRILSCIKLALTHFEIPFHVYEHTSNKCWDIRIRRLFGIRNFLQIVLATPLLGKRQECQLLLEFVESRLGLDGKPLPNRISPYTPRASQIAEEIKAVRTSQRAYAQRLSAEDVLWTSTKVEEQDGNNPVAQLQIA